MRRITVRPFRAAAFPCCLSSCCIPPLKLLDTFLFAIEFTSCIIKAEHQTVLFSEEGIIISVKNDAVLSHIEALASGTKISVRGLAAELNISEGTVYKAIKEAEARGLVITKPKSGTFRVEAETGGNVSLSLIDIVAALGTSCVAGKRSIPRTIKKLLLCDSDETQLAWELSESDPVQTLCIVGNRADLQTLIVQSGANLIVTGGYRPNDYVIAKADRTGSCVLCAAQNTYAVLRLLESFFSDHAPEAESGKAAQWMQMPNFLYKDDIAADWFRFYSDHFHGFQGFPIMSDDRTVYGNLDVIQSFSVPHSQKLASLLSDDVQTLCVDADTPMPRLAQRMILSNSPYATVIHDGHAAGFVYYTDVLRYFLFAKSEGGAPEFSSKLSFIPELSNEDRRVYEVNFTESERLETDLLTVPLFHLAAKKHIAHVGGSEYLPLSSSFVFSSAADAQSTLFLSTIISPASGHTIHVDAELYTEDKTIARAMLVFAKQ